MASANSWVCRASGDPRKCENSDLPEPAHSAIIFILIGKKGNKLSDTIEAAFFYGDYTELREIWKALEDEQNSDVETTE